MTFEDKKDNDNRLVHDEHSRHYHPLPCVERGGRILYIPRVPYSAHRCPVRSSQKQKDTTGTNHPLRHLRITHYIGYRAHYMESTATRLKK